MFERVLCPVQSRTMQECDSLLSITKAEILSQLGVLFKDFQSISPRHLEIVFNIIDKNYMDSFFQRNYAGKFCFRLSKRLTSSAGQIKSRRSTCDFEIAISVPIMFNFGKVNETAVVNGQRCVDRLECLISVMQHEMVHSIEVINYGNTGHSASFKSIARDLFGHTEACHRMDTAKTVAHVAQDIRIGNRVAWSHKGTEIQGIVINIVKNATILTDKGDKWRVSLNLLRRV